MRRLGGSGPGETPGVWAFNVIMDRIQLRNELTALIARYGRERVSKALSLLVQEIVRKAKP